MYLIYFSCNSCIIKYFSYLYNSAIIQDNQSRKLVTINVGNQGDDPVVIGEEGKCTIIHVILIIRFCDTV